MSETMREWKCRYQRCTQINRSSRCTSCGMHARHSMFLWTCHACKHELNTNTDHNCTSCGAPIRCEAAGGHHTVMYPRSREDSYCDRGCGYNFRTSATELDKRRADY